MGGEVGGIPVYHIDTLEDYLREHPTSVASSPFLTGWRMNRQPPCGGGHPGHLELLPTPIWICNLPGPVVENVHLPTPCSPLSYMISE